MFRNVPSSISLVLLTPLLYCDVPCSTFHVPALTDPPSMLFALLFGIQNIVSRDISIHPCVQLSGRRLILHVNLAIVHTISHSGGIPKGPAP